MLLRVVENEVYEVLQGGERDGVVRELLGIAMSAWPYSVDFEACSKIFQALCPYAMEKAKHLLAYWLALMKVVGIPPLTFCLHMMGSSSR